MSSNKSGSIYHQIVEDFPSLSSCHFLSVIVRITLLTTTTYVKDFKLIVHLSINRIKAKIKDNKVLVTNKVSHIQEATRHLHTLLVKHQTC